MEFNEVLLYPTEREAWLKTVLIGGVLVFFGFLLIPLFLVYGYVVRTIDESLSGASMPPVFEEWGTLLVKGFQAWLISIIYLLVPILVAGLTVGGALVAIATGGEAGLAAGAGGLFFGLVLSGILAIVFGYLAVIGIVNFAREDRFGAAFDLEVIKTVALDREYAIAWLISIALFLVAGIVNAIPLVGWILMPFVSFYVAVVAANLWAGGFGRALGTTADLPRPSDEEATV